MFNPYSTSTHDTPDSKQLVCGRKWDLEQIFRLISEDQSIALFGEKRIGKTLTLYLIRDIIDKSIDEYKDRMCDKDFSTWITELETNHPVMTSPTECNLAGLQSVVPRSITDIVRGLHKTFPSSEGSEKESLTELFTKLDADRTSHLVILIDEMEEIIAQRFDDLKAVFQQLRSTIQSCENVSFVLPGADCWVEAVKDVTSPLYGNVSDFFLSIPDLMSVRESYCI